MFFANKALYSPILSLKPVLRESILSHSIVRRLVGMRTNRELNTVAINNVVEKTKGKGIVGNAAALARALILVDAHNPMAAVEEVENVLPDIKNEALRHMAVGIRLAARNYLLDLKETALSVSGGATESEVSTLRTEVEHDYNALQTLAPNCWLIQLACAEYKLYLGHSEEAYTSFVDIEKKINNFLKEKAIWTSDEATVHNTNIFALLGFQLQRALNTKATDPRGSQLVSEIVTQALYEPTFAANFEEFKKQSGVELSDDEAFEVIFALYNSNIRHHFHEFFPAPFEYNDWESPSALTAKNVVLQALAHKEEYVSDEHLAAMRAAYPPKSFYASDKELREVMKGVSKDGNVIEEIRNHFGKGPQTPLSGADQPYYEATKMLNTNCVSRDIAGTVAYAKRQGDVARVLAKQILYRVQVQMSVALAELHQFQDAEKVVTPVINADEYIYMWRALLARSRIYKGLGLITPSDRDMKTLKMLKRHTSERAPYDMVENEQSELRWLLKD